MDHNAHKNIKITIEMDSAFGRNRGMDLMNKKFVGLTSVGNSGNLKFK